MVKMIGASVLSLLTVAALAAPLRSQSLLVHDTNSTRLDRYAYVLGSSLVFSLGDYVGFNLLKKAHSNGNFKAPLSFRLAEG
ncbi:MAG TPA: hypothetical protein VFD13_02250, partial [Candidatus Kapabacteria bacterium]|nr:hypothetical protein [Candidatus Kapabacteria bacterium]